MASTTDRRVGGRYELVRRIARGGGGTVWAGYDHLLERDVAVKHVPIPDDLPPPEREVLRARVRSEARAAARLLHPSAVTIFDVVADDGDVHLVLELVDDPTLDDLVARDGPLPEAEVAAVGLGLLDVLTAAHERGIVHRDVKPANIFVAADGAVKLTDFGIAAMEGETRLTRTGATMGSPQFIAPEQAQGHDAAPSADLWGLGASLYLAVEGVPPFERNNAVATVHAVVHEDARPYARADALAPVLDRLLAKQPQDRPSEAWLRDRLAAIAGAAPTGPSDDRDTAVIPVHRASGSSDASAVEEPDVTDAHDGGPSVLSASVEVPTPPRPTDEPAAATPAADAGARRWLPAAIVLALIAVVGAVLLVRGGAATRDADAPDGGGAAAPTEDAPQEDGGDGTDDVQGSDGATDDPAATSEGGDDAAEDASDADDPAATTEGGDDAAEDATDTTESGDASADTDVPEAEVPADWEVREGPAYEVAVPASWERTPRRGRLVDFRDPDSSTYLRVDWTPDPEPDPYANWQRYSEDLAERFEDYEEIQLREVTFRGEPAALLEYTYTAGGTRLRAYNLNLLAGDRAYALNLQSRADDWEQVAPMFPAIVGGFQPDG